MLGNSRYTHLSKLAGKKLSLIIWDSFSLLAQLSFLLPSMGWRVLENRPLPWVETHCGEHARRLLSDRILAWYHTCCTGSLNNSGIFCKGMRETQPAQVTVSKHIMGHAFWTVPSKAMDGSCIKDSSYPIPVQSSPQRAQEAKRPLLAMTTTIKINLLANMQVAYTWQILEIVLYHCKVFSIC